MFLCLYDVEKLDPRGGNLKMASHIPELLIGYGLNCCTTGDRAGGDRFGCRKTGMLLNKQKLKSDCHRLQGSQQNVQK